MFIDIFWSMVWSTELVNLVHHSLVSGFKKVGVGLKRLVDICMSQALAYGYYIDSAVYKPSGMGVSKIMDPYVWKT